MSVEQLGIPFHSIYSYKSGTCKKREAVFRCHCGKVFITDLVKGRKIQSCGCVRDTANRDRHKVHNLSGHKSYRAWQSMMQRCYNKEHKSYGDYGGRGIVVCDRWHSVENFVADMGERPYGLSLDRIDNSLGYFKENCKWSSDKEQGRNRRSNKLLTIDGTTKCIKDWSEHIGVTAKYHTICKRLENGWEPEKAVFAASREIKRP